MAAPSALTFRALRARAVDVPMARPLRTAGGLVATAPLVLIDVETTAGVTGRSYIFCYTPLVLGPVAGLLAALGAVLKDQPLVPLDVERGLQQRFRLLGPQGLTGMAMAGIDMACWDAHSRAAGLPLVRMLGGAARPLRAYNSTGLGLIGADAATRAGRSRAGSRPAGPGPGVGRGRGRSVGVPGLASSRRRAARVAASSSAP